MCVPARRPSPALDRVHSDLLGKFVDRAFHHEGGHLRRRRAIGSGLRPVDQHFVADSHDVFEPVAGESGHRAELGPYAATGAAGVAQLEVDADDPVEFLVGDRMRIGVGRDPGVVDQAVEATAEFLPRVLGQ